MFSQIHEITFHGQGGYDWDTVYNMPIWLRKFTFEKLKEYYDKQAEENKKAQDLINKSSKSSKEISKPNIAPPKPPTYIAKAPKK